MCVCVNKKVCVCVCVTKKVCVSNRKRGCNQRIVYVCVTKEGVHVCVTKDSVCVCE